MMSMAVSVFVDIDEPNGKAKDQHRHNESSPKERILTKPSQIDQNDPQAIQCMDEETQQKQNINGCVEMDLLAGVENIRHFAPSRPAGVNLYGD